MNDAAEAKITKAIEKIADAFERVARCVQLQTERTEPEESDNFMVRRQAWRDAKLSWCAGNQPCFFCGSTSGVEIARGVQVVGCSICIGDLMSALKIAQEVSK